MMRINESDWLMKRDIFICFTPLQMWVAKAIIESDSYEGGKPDFYLFALADTERYRFYYDRLSLLCSDSEFIKDVPAFPFYLSWMKKRFSKKPYRNIYLASIDSVQVQYILSVATYENIRTFDDGTANIIASSAYFEDKPKLIEIFKRAIRRATGNRYSRAKIATESEAHYTLYSGLTNITHKTRPVLIAFEGSAGIPKLPSGEVVVLLGTVYQEVLEDDKFKMEFLNKVQIFLNGFKNIVYLPHPRDESDYFDGVIKYSSSLISEEVVMALIKEHGSVKLVGFASSTQFNLMAQPSVKNLVLTSSLVKDSFVGLSAMLVSNGAVAVSID